MTDSIGTLTTVLFLPGSNARALEKAKGLQAGAIIIDLEDAVGISDKAVGRDQAAAAVMDHHANGAYDGRQLFIRVNGLDSPFWPKDAAMIRALITDGTPPDGVVCPKVNSAEDVKQLASDLAGVSLYAMIETPQAVLNAADIAAATPALKGLMAGTNDLKAELNAIAGPDRAEIMASLQIMVLAGKAAGLQVFDGVYNDVKDEAGLIAEAAQGRRLGFDGKCLIHPSQIEPVKAAFLPTQQEVADAAGLIEAFEAAGKGVATYKGKMVEELHVRTARRVLALVSGS